MTTRSPSPELLQLGRGIVRWAPIVDGVRQQWLDMGNCEQFTIGTADTKLTKKSSRTATNLVYKEVTSEREVTLNIQGDEFDMDVLAAILQGTLVTVDAVAGDDVVAEALGTPGELGILVQTAFPLISAVALKQGGTTFGADDYEIRDASRGIIYLKTAAEGGDINPAVALTIDYTYASSIAGQKIEGGTKSVVEASIHFAADNAEGPNRDGLFYRASLTSDGEFGLIATGNDYGTWKLKCKLLDDSDGNFGGSEDCPMFELTDVPVAA